MAVLSNPLTWPQSRWVLGCQPRGPVHLCTPPAAPSGHTTWEITYVGTAFFYGVLQFSIFRMPFPYDIASLKLNDAEDGKFERPVKMLYSVCA